MRLKGKFAYNSSHCVKAVNIHRNHLLSKRVSSSSPMSFLSICLFAVTQLWKQTHFFETEALTNQTSRPHSFWLDSKTLILSKTRASISWMVWTTQCLSGTNSEGFSVSDFDWCRRGQAHHSVLWQDYINAVITNRNSPHPPRWKRFLYQAVSLSTVDWLLDQSTQHVKPWGRWASAAEDHTEAT